MDGIDQLSAKLLCTLYIMYTLSYASEVQKGLDLQSQADTQFALHIVYIEAQCLAGAFEPIIECIAVDVQLFRCGQRISIILVVRFNGVDQIAAVLLVILY